MHCLLRIHIGKCDFNCNGIIKPVKVHSVYLATCEVATQHNKLKLFKESGTLNSDFVGFPTKPLFGEKI